MPAWWPPSVRRVGDTWWVQLPGTPPSRNEVDKRHWGATQALRDELLPVMRSLRVRAGYPTLEQVRLVPVLFFPRAARRDPKNYGDGGGLKPYVDALVRAGWFKDDRPPWYLAEDPVFRKGPHRTVLVLQQVAPGGATWRSSSPMPTSGDAQSSSPVRS